MVRACVIPNNEFVNVQVDHVTRCANDFYELFEKCFGRKQCSYSVHVLSCHLLQIKGNEPLTFKSAFKFESFYSEMKNSFHPGTNSTLKQILSNVIMKRYVEHHVCSISIYLKPDKLSRNGQPVKQSKECNDLIYTYIDNHYEIYKVCSPPDETHVSCLRQGFYPATFPLTPHLTWSDVGVFRVGPSCHLPCNIELNAVCGKVLKVDKYFITCPVNILREK